ncbi:MAG: glycosyltransferase [Actinomycetota bacterium]|nr:glycosyltransferase [Actinomycetota bacterium]
MPTFSVVLNTYNRAELVPDALDSVLRQAGPSFEVVVVDDGSTDGTAAYLASVTDPRVRSVRLRNGGLSKARNAGLQRATGDWVLFLDDDDQLLDGSLAELDSLIDATTGLVSGAARFVDEDGEHRHTAEPRDLGPVFGRIRALYRPGAFAVRRDVVEASGGYDPDIEMVEQTELFIRLSAHIAALGLEARWTRTPVVAARWWRPAERTMNAPHRIIRGVERVMAKHPVAFASDRRLAANFWRTAGVAAARIGDWPKARRLFVRSVRAAPTDPSNFARLLLAVAPPLGRSVWMPRTATVIFRPKEGPAGASSRYRCFHVAAALEAQGHRTGFLSPSLLRTPRWSRALLTAREALLLVMNRPDVVFFHKPGFRDEDALLVRVAKLTSARVIVDFDDPFVESNRTLVRCLARADVIFLGHDALRQCLPTTIDHRRVQIRPTPIPTATYAINRVPIGERPIVIGWIGSPAQAEQLDAIIRAIDSTALGARNVAVELIGIEPASISATEHVPVAVTENLKWDDEAAVAAAVTRFDIGLAPYRGRPGVAFKVLQYLAAGARPIIDRDSPGRVYVESDQALARVVDFRDSDALLAALCDEVDSRRHSAVATAQQQAGLEQASRFDTGAFARHVID